MWALSTDKESEAAIDNLQMKIDLTLLDQEYQNCLAQTVMCRQLFLVMIWMCNVLWIFVMLVMCLKQRMWIILPCYCFTASWLEDNTESLSAQQDFIR